VHGGAITFPNTDDAAIACGVELQRPDVMKQVGAYMRASVGDARIPTYHPEDIPYEKDWYTSTTDDRYEASNLGTLRRVDGTPVGWMPLTRYGEIVGIPKPRIVSMLVHGWRTRKGNNPLNGLTTGWEHPYNGRMTDVQPYYPTVNMLPIVAIPVGMTVDASSLLNMAMALIYDELALMDFTRMATATVGTNDVRHRSKITKDTSGSVSWWANVHEGTTSTNIGATNVMWMVVPDKINPMGAYLFSRHGRNLGTMKALRNRPRVSGNPTFPEGYAGKPLGEDTPQQRAQSVLDLVRAEIAAEVALFRKAVTGKARKNMQLLDRLKRRQGIARAMGERILIDGHMAHAQRMAASGKRPVSEFSLLLEQHGAAGAAMMASVRVPSVQDAIKSLLDEAEPPRSPFTELHCDPRLRSRVLNIDLPES
jgi:hypothetical protein